MCIRDRTEGATNPKVAIIPPKTEAARKPAKVAILTPIAPGVDCDTAIISINIFSSNQGYLAASSYKNGIVESPPPTENNPTLKNSKNKVKYTIYFLPPIDLEINPITPAAITMYTGEIPINADKTKVITVIIIPK